MGSPFIAVGVALYLVWMRMTDYLKSSPPDSLPSWPLLIIFAPIWKFLNMIGVTQRTEFSSRLDMSRRYLVACSPHGSYALSGLTWIAPEFRMSWLPEYEHHCTFFGAASCLFYLPLVREFVLLLGCREVRGVPARGQPADDHMWYMGGQVGRWCWGALGSAGEKSSEGVTRAGAPL